MNIVITGSSKGIGLAIASYFLDKGGYIVHGIDILPPLLYSDDYIHHQHDVTGSLPDIQNVHILINNAGVQTNSSKDIEVNLNGVINVTEKYGLQAPIKSIVNIASASAHSGLEFPHYVASKGGVLAYTKWTAIEVAKFGATCNSVSPGGVHTELNAPIEQDPKKLAAVFAETLLGKWASPNEIAELVYYLAVLNKSITAQDILVDNGEMAKGNFIW